MKNSSDHGSYGSSYDFLGFRHYLHLPVASQWSFLNSPSGILVRQNQARLRTAPLRFAPLRFARIRFASFRFAPLRSAPLRFASASVVRYRFAPLRFAPLRFAPRRSTPSRFARCKFAPLRSHFGHFLVSFSLAMGAESSAIEGNAPIKTVAASTLDRMVRISRPLLAREPIPTLGGRQ